MSIQIQDPNERAEEVYLIDVLLFLKSAWKMSVMTALCGLIFAIVYTLYVPSKYEAIAQIAMAQISATNNSNTINPPAVNIEEPSLLISRLSSPTSFPPQVQGACGIDQSPNSAAILSKSIKLASPRGVANVVELRTFGKSKEEALLCSQAIFELIKTTQAQIVAPYIADAKIKLDDDIERLAKAKEVVAKVDKSGSAMGAAYLSTRDEIRFLLDEITALKNVVTSNQSRETRLLAPIYASDTPIAPKKRIVLVMGVLSGLFLGLLLALGRQMSSKLKANLQKQGRQV